MTLVNFIDAHVHANNRSSEDFERLASVGCKGIIAVAGSEAGFRSPDSVLDYFARLDRVDRARVERSGVAFHLALGIHPEGIPESGLESLMASLPEVLRSHRAVAVGEIGLQHGGEKEENLLFDLLNLANGLCLPAIVHTPRTDKRRQTERILHVLSQSPLAPDQVLVDHLEDEVVNLAKDAGCCIGLSVHPAKLSPVEVAKIVARIGPEGLVVSTDMGADPSHLFGLPAAISAMQELGLKDQVIRAVVHDNAAELIGHSH